MVSSTAGAISQSSIPEDFDNRDYLRLNPDVAAAGVDPREHYLECGRLEGRLYKFVGLREQVISRAATEQSLLEIGPFCSPCVLGSNVKYFDVLPTEELRNRAAIFQLPIDKVPDIDFVSADGDIATIPERFSAAFSAHCIEHQPDLIRHLQQVAEVLRPGGRYYLVVPDKRYCFDHYIPTSTVEDVLEARGRRRHPTLKVIEHRAFTTHNDASRHWAGDHADEDYFRSIHARVKIALQEIEAAAGQYIDVHSWQFTPTSFEDILTQLQELDLSPFFVEEVYETPHGRFEFTAVLRSR